MVTTYTGAQTRLVNDSFTYEPRLRSSVVAMVSTLVGRAGFVPVGWRFVVVSEQWWSPPVRCGRNYTNTGDNATPVTDIAHPVKNSSMRMR